MDAHASDPDAVEGDDVAKQITLEFKREKETPNKIRWEEQGDDDNPAVGKLYLTKDAVKKLGAKGKLEVIIKAV